MELSDARERPLISICIATYRRPIYLRRAIESIVSQSEFSSGEFELLISDDASPDGGATAAILAKLNEQNPNVRTWIQKRNKGEGANELFLIKHSLGKYVFFITDDDYILPGGLARMLGLAKEHPDCTLIATSYEIHPEHESRTLTHHTFAASRFIERSEVEAIAALIQDYHISSREFVRRDVIDIDARERHIPSLYQHLHTIGVAALRGRTFYSTRLIIAHTIQNETFWQYTDDHMFRGTLEIMKDLAAIEPQFFKPAFTAMVTQVREDSAYALSRGPVIFLRYAWMMLRMRETRFHPTVWVGLTNAILRFVRHGTRKNIASLWQLLKQLPGYETLRGTAKHIFSFLTRREQMFISDRYHCIFIRMPRTGSTTLLTQFPEIHAAYSPPTRAIMRMAGRKWDEYFKFVFVRNTWDRVLSIYLYLDKRMREHAEGVVLKHQPKEWLDTNGNINAFLKHFYYKYGAAWIEDMHEIFNSQIRWLVDQETGREFSIDFIGRYERLQDDFDIICDRIGKPHTVLPHINATVHDNYRKHYDAEARAIVAEIYRDEIERFGYTF